MGKICTASGYIIHQHKFQNSSLILHVFTKEFGKIHLLAKGIRNNKKQKSEISPFQELNIEFQHSDSLCKLRSIEITNHYNLSELLHKTVGLYFIELIYKAFVDYEASKEFYTFYNNAIQILSQTAPLNSMFLRKFELKLLKSCGFSIEIDPSWDPKQYLKIDKINGLITTEFSNQGICKVSELNEMMIGKPLDKKSLNCVAKLIYQAIDLAVNFKPINSRDLIKIVWNK